VRVALLTRVIRTITLDCALARVFLRDVSLCFVWFCHAVLLLRLPFAVAYDRQDMELTFAIIKPDAVKARFTGKIVQRIEEAGFQIRAMRMAHLTQKEAEGFYAVHRERPFFASLTKFMSSGPVVLMALEAQDAIRKWRTLMGATDPAKAEAGTLRKEFGKSIETNATHGSDAPETAAFELGYFFAGVDLAR
jgi:nucleoside-diphosphate kinase